MNTLTPTEERVGTLRRHLQTAAELCEALRPLKAEGGLWSPYHHATNLLRSLRAMIGEAEREGARCD